MSRPGVMLYFSILPALDSLSPASAGTLLLAAMHYAQDGQEPVLEDDTLSFAWAFLKPSIDRDGEAYDEKRKRGEWLTYCRQCKRDDIEPFDFETWRERTVTEPLLVDTDTQPISLSMSNTVSVSNKSIGADKPPKRSRFVPPTVDEVQKYCKERHSSVDPIAFVSFYESKGWMVGKNKMRSWRSAISSWERRDKAEQKGGAEDDYWSKQ